MFNNLPSQLFSPGKTLYISYVVLNIFKDGTVDWWQFAFLSLLFAVLEIVHNDYLRIKLNHAACQKCQCGDMDTKLKIAELELEKERIKNNS